MNAGDFVMHHGPDSCHSVGFSLFSVTSGRCAHMAVTMKFGNNHLAIIASTPP